MKQSTAAKGRRLICAAALLPLLSLVATDAVALTEQSGNAAITLTIGPGSAPPDSPLIIPVELSRESAVTVGSLDIQLLFPKTLLSFVRIEPSGLAAAIDATLQSEVKESSDGSSVLNASVSTIGPRGSRKGIPDGPVAYFVFRTGKVAAPEKVIALSAQASAMTTDDPPKLIAPVALAFSEVVVSDPAVAACFFYMH